MSNSISAAYGIYPQDTAVQQVVRTLNQSGFEKEQICMMVSPKHPIAMTMREGNMFDSRREDIASTTELMAWLMKFGAVMIPTVGLFVRSQTFLEELVVRKDPRFGQGNSKALVSLGFSEGDALRFDRQLREKGILIYVACPDGTTQAVEVLRQTGAREAASLEKAAA